MNSAYAVGAEFTLLNLFSPEVKKISDDLVRLDAKIEGTKKNLKSIIPANLTKRIESVAGSFDLLGPSADKAALAMIGAMGKAETGVMKAATGINGELDAAFADADVAANKAANGMIAAMRRAELASKGSADAIALGFGSAFTGMDAGLVASTDGITKQLGRITRSAGRSATAIGNMRREIEALSALSSAPMPQLPAGAGGFGRGGGNGHRGQRSGGGGFNISNHEHVNTPIGRVSGHGGGMAGLIGAGLVADGVYEAAELEDIVTKVLITSQLTPGEQPLTRNNNGKEIADMIKRGAVISGLSMGQVGEMFLGNEREFGGIKFDKKIDVMSQLLPAISAEAHLRHESLAEAGESLIGVLHQSGLFTPEEMVKGAKEFQFTTMNTPSSLEQFKNALSYTMTPLHGGIGMDTGTIMLLTSLMQSSGIQNSKAGTWARQMFVEAEPSTDMLGPLTKTQKQHNEALSMLGLLGADGKQNWKVNGEDGKTDWNASVIKMFGEMHAGMAAIPEGERADVLHRAFGTQGAGAATLFSQPNIIDQLGILVPKLKAFKGGDLTLEEYSEGSTIQKARIAEQEFQTLMADLGTKILPTVNAALTSTISALSALPDDWEKTKKLWSDRLHFLTHPFGGSDAPAYTGPTAPPAPDQGYLMGPGFQLNAYHEGEAMGGGSSAEDVIYRGTLRAFTDFANGKSAWGGSTASGSGFQNASFEGGDFGFGGSGGGGGGGGGAANLRYGAGGHSPAADLAGGAATGEHADYIRTLAKSLGIDPAVAVAVANSEGLHSFVGDRGSSFGDFQLHYGGMAGGGMATGGLGDDFTRETGLDARNPANWKAADEWALKRAVKGGWGPWHGAAHIGVHGMAGIGGRPTGAFTAAPDGNFPGLAGGDTVGIAMGMLGFGEGQSAAALGHHMSPGEWCADFVNGVIEKAGGKGTGSSMANSFSRWGEHVDIASVMRGDVIEETHGRGTPVHHAGIATGEVQRDANGNITHIGMVSGNYGHMVKRNWEPVGIVGDLRRGASAVRMAPKQPDVHHVYTTVSLDGKQVGKTVAKIMGKSMRYPTSMGAPDSHSFHVSPGTPVMDSA